VNGDAYSLLFEGVDTMVCTLDLEGRFTDVNRAGELLTGFSREELIGRAALDLIAPDVRERAVTQFRERLAGAGDRPPDESVLLARDGRRVPIEITSTLFAERGNPEGVLGIVRDLTERRNAVVALEHSERRFQALLESAPDAVVIADQSGSIVLANAQTEKLFGYERAELLGKAVEVLLPESVRGVHASHRGEYAADPRLRQMGAGLELEGRRKDGSTFPVDVSLSPLQTEDGLLVLAAVRDVTERKRAEEALRRSEQRFRDSFESAAIGMALVATDGRFLDANSSLCEILGYSPDDLVSRTFQEITHPDDLDADLEYVRQMLAGEIASYQMEKRYFHRDGRIVWALLSVSLVKDGDGEPLYFVSQIQDISVRKQAQHALERSQAQLAEAQELAQICSWERDGDGALRWSDGVCRVFGFDPETGVPTEAQVLQRVHPDDRELVRGALEKARASSDPLEIEFRIVHPDGRVRWIHTRGRTVVGADGSVARRVIAQDVTERKEAERRYRMLVEQLPLAMYIRPLDMSKPNIYCSPQVEPMLGYPASEWETDSGLLARIVHPEDRDRVLYEAKRLRTTGEPVRDEYRYVTPDGRTVWVQDETYLVPDENGEPAFVQGYLLDITERKQAEGDRDLLRDELHRAQKLEALGRLAGGVAHDFNNMLTAIRGYSELLLDRLEPGSDAHGEAAEIKRATEQASALPQQLLAFGRRQSLEPKLVDLNQVVAATSALLRHLLTEAVELVTVPEATAPTTFVDPGQIEHALVNLALNARDAMPGGGTLTVSTRNADVDGGRYVVLSVADNGSGMDAETRARVFEPFFTTKPQGQGTGLGLASVYGTVTQSDGFVRLDSEPGRGTTVELYLRFAPSPLASVPEPSPEPRRRLPTVLIAEDEDIVRRLAANVLSREGFHVVTAADGAEALRLYEDLGAPLDVLLTDVVMPGVGGRELARRIRELDPALPIVFMSGYTGPAGGADLGALERSTFLQKPFSPRVLVETVRRAIDEQPALTCLVADDHPTVLDSVSRFLESKGISVVRATNGKDALAEISRSSPSVALVDVAMKPMDGMEVMRRAPGTPVILYTGHPDRSLVDAALAAGARGFVLKAGSLSELEQAVRTVADGGSYVDPRLTVAESPAVRLTPREREVLRLVADGMTNDRVAAELAISPETVQTHVRKAMEKLDADTRTEAVATALRKSLIA
jgi:PAS domain S-box-containing protein